MATSTYTVAGMTCDHCVNAVRAEVGQVPGVTDVDVDLASGRLTINTTTTVDDQRIREAVEEAGYEVKTP